MVWWNAEKGARPSAIAFRYPSGPGSPGKLWSTKWGARISSSASRSHSNSAAKKRRTTALFPSASDDTAASSYSLRTCILLVGRHHEHDAAWSTWAHQLNALIHPSAW